MYFDTIGHFVSLATNKAGAYVDLGIILDGGALRYRPYLILEEEEAACWFQLLPARQYHDDNRQDKGNTFPEKYWITFQ
jgi:hypothetical protein